MKRQNEQDQSEKSHYFEEFSIDVFVNSVEILTNSTFFHITKTNEENSHSVIQLNENIEASEGSRVYSEKEISNQQLNQKVAERLSAFEPFAKL